MSFPEDKYLSELDLVMIGIYFFAMCVTIEIPAISPRFVLVILNIPVAYLFIKFIHYLYCIPTDTRTWENLYRSVNHRGATKVRYLAKRARISRIRCHCMCFVLVRRKYLYVVAKQNMSRWQLFWALRTAQVGMDQNRKADLMDLVGLTSEPLVSTPSS